MESLYSFLFFQGMIGTGRTSIAAAADLSRACVTDMGDAAPEAIHALASLGNWGSQCQNQERDLHTWVNKLYNMKLTPFEVHLSLQVQG